MTLTNGDGDSIYVPEKAANNFSFDIDSGTLTNYLWRDYYKHNVGSNLNTDRVMYDTDGVETSDFS